MRKTNSINLGNLLLSFSDAIDLADPVIAQHQQRVAYIAWEISKVANLSDDEIRNIFIASLFHDTGAITIEEKISLHNFKYEDIDRHCLRGELLLKRIPFFKTIAEIVKCHHKKWDEWDESIENSYVWPSQIILFSDYVERLIKRDHYILQQTERIIDEIQSLSGTFFHQKVIDYFIAVSKREEFWLDLISPRLYSLLFHSGPLKNIEIDFAEIEILSKLFRDIIDFKSPFTATHTSGVSSCAEILSMKFGLTEIEIQGMKIAGNLHDLGKLAISNSILDKPGKLTKDEFNVIRSHTYYSYYIINSIDNMQLIAEWAAYHHEKLDGSGYPFHYSARQLNIGARIMAVADIFTALTENRPYRKGMSKSEIIDIIQNMASKNFLDKRIVQLLIDNFDEIDDHVKIIQEAAKEFYETRFLAIA